LLPGRLKLVFFDWGTGKQADWGRPLVGPVTGTTGEIRYCTGLYRWRLDTGLQYWHGQASFLHNVLLARYSTISRRRHSLRCQERTAIAPFGSAQRGRGYAEFRHVFQLSKAGERIGQRGKWKEKYTGRPRPVGETPEHGPCSERDCQERQYKTQFVLK